MNLLRPYEDSRKPPAERAIYSDNWLMGYFSTSANAVIGACLPSRLQTVGHGRSIASLCRQVRRFEQLDVDASASWVTGLLLDGLPGYLTVPRPRKSAPVLPA